MAGRSTIPESEAETVASLLAAGLTYSQIAEKVDASKGAVGRFVRARPAVRQRAKVLADGRARAARQADRRRVARERAKRRSISAARGDVRPEDYGPMIPPPEGTPKREDWAREQRQEAEARARLALHEAGLTERCDYPGCGEAFASEHSLMRHFEFNHADEDYVSPVLQGILDARAARRRRSRRGFAPILIPQPALADQSVTVLGYASEPPPEWWLDEREADREALARQPNYYVRMPTGETLVRHTQEDVDHLIRHGGQQARAPAA